MALNKFKRLIINPMINYLGNKKLDQKFSKPPILIGGCGRSGTTLLLSIIGAHPQIHNIPEELGIFIEWHDNIGLYTKFSSKQDEIFPRIDRLHRKLLASQIPKGVNRWCEKTPRNVQYFDEILNYFGKEIKLIHIIRDGRDVMLSKHPTNSDKYWVDSKRWINDVKLGLKYKDHSQVFTVKYENLITDYETTIEKLCEFLDEECTAELYNWVENTNVKENLAWEGKVKKLHSDSIGKWKTTEDKERVQEVMENKEVVRLLEELDYL